MGVIQVFDIVKILKKQFVRIVALCLAVGLAAYCLTAMSQTYTCTLNYKYNYDAALEGKAPDGESELDPYELKNPAVIQAAINQMNTTEELSVEVLRSNMAISTVITSLDQEVSESAAVLGEKYEVQPVEYQLDYTYSADLGSDFGPRMFDGIIAAYDEFVINKYYNKEHVADFMQAIQSVEMDYQETSDIMYDRITDIVEDMDEMYSWFPEYRSVRTGYTFGDLSSLYQNLRETHQAKYAGNVRAGNLTKDSELLIKNYTAIITDLEKEIAISEGVAENYKEEIGTFYESYKDAGLYNQADRVQSDVSNTNNQDQEIFRDYEQDFDKLANTYDKIVTNYTTNATGAAYAVRDVEYYNAIIDSYVNDTIPQETKDKLLADNETILAEMAELSSQYSKLANEVIDEFYSDKVSTEIQYLISTDVSADKSPLVMAILAMAVVGVLAAIVVIFWELFHGNTDDSSEDAEGAEEMAPGNLDEEHRIAYEQYQKGFEEFYLAYQPMVGQGENLDNHFEVFLRWENETLGNVSPMQILDYYSDLKLVKELNRWIFSSVCRDIPKITRRISQKPVIHVNCIYSEIEDFGLNEMLVENIKRYGISPSSLCIELDGDDIVSCLDDIMTLQDMGLRIGVDHFEAKDSENEILQVIKPDYVKISSDVFLHSDFSTTADELHNANLNMVVYIMDIIRKCSDKNIKTCICGIETQAQHESLLRMNFSFRQGFYYGKPMRLNECIEHVIENRIRTKGRA